MEEDILLTDFESKMNTIFGAMSWTNTGSTPAIHLGNVRGGQSDQSSANVLAEAMGTEPYITGNGSVAYSEYVGEVRGWGNTAAIRDNILADCIAEFPGQEVFMGPYDTEYYKNFYRFTMEVRVFS